MTSREFIDEVMASPICPEGFLELYSDFRRFQAEAIRALLEFHRVCEKNGVLYQAAYGSLLGAVRDGGQIPWDYDVDVFVPYSEREKLIRALEADLGDDFYYYSPETDGRCRHMIIRLAPKGYRTEALHVDVFFLVGVPDDEAERMRFAKKIRKLTEKRFYKFINIGEESRPGSRYRMKLMFLRAAYSLCPIGLIQKEYDKLCGKYPCRESEYFVEGSFFADKKYRIPKRMVYETELLETDFGKVRVPADHDGLLRLIYGNYMQPPSLEARLGELMQHYRRLKQFESYGKKN